MPVHIGRTNFDWVFHKGEGMEHKINWGISPDLQADVRFEPNACKSYVMDISLGCPHHCIYCIFSPLELKVYKLLNPEYQGEVLPLKLDRLLARQDLPPVAYMCYSSDPLGNEELIQSTLKVLNNFFEHGVNVIFISKGVFTAEVLQVIRHRPELMHIQIDVANCDGERNRIVEPGAPPYEKRLENLEQLAAIPGLGSLSVRIDPLLPQIDDTERNITRILDDACRLGVKEAVLGYVVLTRSMRDSWLRNDYTRACAQMLSEKTPTISEQELYSLPFEAKLAKLIQFEAICRSKGVKMSCCGCKDERLKQTSLEWICHPFNRQRREELMKDSAFPMEVAHLK
jgi:DNA repair photolyase